MSDDTRLSEFDKDEWREIVRMICPNKSEAEFSRYFGECWAEFVEYKRRKQLN